MAERAQIIIGASDQSKAAFASAQRNLAQLKTSVTGSVAAIGAAFAGITAAVAAVAVGIDKLNPRAVIDTADALAKLSQRSGVGVEALSALQYQAKLSDVSTEQLAESLKKLNINIAAAARGEKEQAEAFKAIGVSVVDSAGKVRGVEEVFADIAERFSEYNDGANKVAIANAVGGRSFANLIPLLNGGRQGIKDARAELEKFGGVISGDLARQSEIFNDNLTKLGVASEALKVSIAGGVISALVDYSNRMVEAAKAGNLFEASVRTLLDVFSGKATRELVFGPDKTQLQQAQADYEKLTTRVAELQKQLALDPGNAGLVNYLAQTQRFASDAARTLDKLKAASAGLGSSGRAADFQRGDKDTTPVPLPTPKRDAPALARTGAADQAAAAAEALRRKVLDGQIKAIENALETERDLFANQNTVLAAEYAEGTSSIERYYAGKARAQADNLARTQALLDEEVRLLRDAQAQVPKDKPQDREDLQNRIEEIYARQAKAAREAGQATEAAERARTSATREFQRAVFGLDAQLAELSGDRYGAELLRNAQKIADAQALLNRGGGDPQRLQALQSALQLQAQFSQAQREYSQISERAYIAESAYLQQAQASAKSRAETEAGIGALREQALRQLDELITKTAELARVTQDPEVITYFEGLKAARQRAFDAKDPGLLRFNDLAREGGEAIAQSFEDAIVSGEKLSDVIGRLDKQLVALITRDLVTQPLADTFTGFIKGLGSGGTGGGAATLLSGIFGSLFHSGGVVGEGGGVLRSAPALAWAGAPRYHSGGVAGMAPDEVPAILRRGEEVLTQADPRHRDNGGGGGQVVNYSPTFIVHGGVDRSTQTQIAARALDGANRAMRIR